MAAALPDLPEVTAATWSEKVEEAPAERLVVIDFYTDWCGPCKVMYPKVQQLALDEESVSFMRLNCNEENKERAKAVGIKVAPTFQFYRGGTKLDEVKGAKWDELVEKVNEHK